MADEPRAARMRPVHIVTAFILVTLSTGIGVVLCEAAYRLALVKWIAPQRFVRPIPDNRLVILGKPFWRFDQRYGFSYPKDETLDNSEIRDGRVVDCRHPHPGNSLGNIGREAGDWSSADLRVLVFGDSFTATQHDGRTWAHLLEERLAAELHKKVSVVNFARDGTGILQMFDQAAGRIEQYKADLVIIAFITNDLQRVRVWRTVTNASGEWRYLATTVPERDVAPDPAISYDTGLYRPDATKEWCERMKASGETDDIIRGALRTYNKGIDAGREPAASPWTLKHSYLASRLLFGDPFMGLTPPFSFPALQLASYADDDRFMQDYRAIVASKTPTVLFHLAFFPEIKEGREYITTPPEQRLLESLTRTTGWPVEETTHWISMPLDRPERMNMAPDNFHPSEFGIALYADAVAKMLIDRSYVKR
jgi:lysophospholipase L1-like esterase